MGPQLEKQPFAQPQTLEKLKLEWNPKATQDTDKHSGLLQSRAWVLSHCQNKEESPNLFSILADSMVYPDH